MKNRAAVGIQFPALIEYFHISVQGTVKMCGIFKSQDHWDGFVRNERLMRKAIISISHTMTPTGRTSMSRLNLQDPLEARRKGNQMKKRNPIQALPTPVAIDVANIVVQEAKKAAGKCAVAGGLAMQLHGFIRNTSDVDVVSSCDIEVGKRTGTLHFGGSIREIAHDWGMVECDVIVMDGTDTELYTEAAAKSVQIAGLPVVRVEYMIIIKHLAGRIKDTMDFQYLATQKKPNRAMIKEIVTRIYGLGGVHIYEDIINDMDTAIWEHSRERKK